MQVQRKKIYDPAFEQFVDEELPTVSVKDAGKFTVDGPAGATALLTRTFSGGTAMRMTFLRVGADQPDKEIYLTDRQGTLDYIYLGTTGSELYRETNLGAPDAPVHVVQGTFTITAGSVAAGTVNFYVAYEGIVRFQGTETRA